MIAMDTQENVEQQTPSEVLQLQHAPMRVAFTWFGTTKALRPDQKGEIAEHFEADEECLSASKKIINRKHPAYRAMTKIKRSITAYWKAKTLPFPEPGIRLLPQAKMADFEEFMQRAKHDLEQAAEELQNTYAADRTLGANLGRTYDPSDYPPDIREEFGVSWNVENVSPPDWLLELKPQWYERELQRVRGLFNNAVELAEGEFVKELTKLVDTLVERLSPNEDGTPKVFGDGCVENLKAFIGRFREMSVKSNDDLEKLVDQCDQLTHGVSAETFRSIPELRQHVASKLAEVKASMEQQMVIAPRRKIVRRAKD